MAFTPKYTITNHLLANITRIHTLIAGLNNRRFPTVVLIEFEKTARAVSSHSSTSIEGNPLPLTEVKKILKSHPQHARDSEKEVLNYNSVLEMLSKYTRAQNKNLNLELILKIQQKVTDQLLPPEQSGHLRNVPVVINNPHTGKTVYMPPNSTDVPALLKELTNYISAAQSEVDPLIIAGIFHKQFVLIHPFTDGNGRSTRLSTKVLLANMGLDTFNLFSFENYYNQNVTKYFQSVGEFGDYYELSDSIDFTTWLEYFTDGIIDELLRVEHLLPETLKPGTDLQAYHRLILKIIDEKGYVTDNDYAKRVKRAKATRYLDFKRLVKLGLIERRGQSRASYYAKVDLNNTAKPTDSLRVAIEEAEADYKAGRNTTNTKSKAELEDYLNLL